MRGESGETQVNELIDIHRERIGKPNTPVTSLCDSVDRPPKYRTPLLDSTIALVENLRSSGVPQRKPSEDFSPDFQVCLPYRGLFVWHVGGNDVVADANQVLFVSGGEAFYLSEPLPSGYAELIVTPDPELLAEIANVSETLLPSHPLFRRRSRRADLRLQSLRARFLHWAIIGDWDDVAAEELVVAVLRSALQVDISNYEPGGTTRRLIARTKEFLEAHLSTPLRLGDVARAVGASPAYLTDVFRRVEGIPVHRYVIQLRLAGALVELPHANDLTTLAFELGFSSHSHFAAAFRRAFGCTPSQFRESTRNPRRPGNTSQGNLSTDEAPGSTFQRLRAESVQRHR
jgi:AraC family transcriptional regulator